MVTPLYPLHETDKKGLSFLVVEPDHGRRGEISSMLEDMGVEADMVSDENHASIMLERKNYHAIMADGGLPGFHGIQLSAALHTMKRSTAMPVVAAMLEKEEEMQSLWEEDGDFDEKMEWPLCPKILKEFIQNCQIHHQSLLTT